MLIPYEPQLLTQFSRRCGAAALCMVYRSLGLQCQQSDLWKGVSAPDGFSKRVARTHLLARAALERGLSAMVLQALDPVAVLVRHGGADLRFILNHRLALDSGAGHYSVFVAMDGDRVIVHDPHFGPNRCYSVDELRELWQPRFVTSEIVGNVLIAFAKNCNLPACCAQCGLPIPRMASCAFCARECPLRPASVLGCAAHDCGGRSWQELFCPFCDEAIAGLA